MHVLISFIHTKNHINLSKELKQSYYNGNWIANQLSWFLEVFSTSKSECLYGRRDQVVKYFLSIKAFYICHNFERYCLNEIPYHQ